MSARNHLGFTLCSDGVSAFDAVSVGHAQLSGPGELSGTTAIVCPAGTTAGVDVRGGGPATHETGILQPGTLPYGIDALVLTGGSAYGLAAARGVQDVLASRGRGCEAMAEVRVPIVPAAAVFDVGRGGSVPSVHGDRGLPSLQTGARAAQNAWDAAPGSRIGRGSVGAGTGAWMGRGLSRGGLGHARVITPSGWSVAALVVANPAGSILSRSGQLYAHALLSDYGIDIPQLDGRSAADAFLAASRREHQAQSPLNTTIACIVTDAPLTDAQCARLAGSAHAGLARAVNPSHTLMDGDTIFALALGDAHEAAAARPLAGEESCAFDTRFPAEDLALLNIAAADALSTALVDAVMNASDYPHGLPAEYSPPPLSAFGVQMVAAWLDWTS